MGGASAWRRGGIAFVLSWGGLVAACWNGGRLLTGSTDVILPSPLAFALLLGWLPALAIGGAAIVVTSAWPRAARPLLAGLLLAIVAAIAVLHFGLRIGDTPESVRDRVAGQASALRPGQVTDYLTRPRATALERDAAVAALADRAVWRRIETLDGLLPADADAIETAVLARLEALPTEGTAHVLLVALATDRLRKESLAETLARWPAFAHDVLSAAAQQPDLVLRAASGCLDEADQSASRALADRSLAASPADARRWLRWLAWSDLHCLAPGRLAAVLGACDTAPTDADRSWCVAMVLRDLPPTRDRFVALDDTDRSALERTIGTLAAGSVTERRLALATELWLEKQTLAPGRVARVIGAAARLEADGGPSAVHTLRWLVTPEVAPRFIGTEGPGDDGDLAAVAAAIDAAVAAGRIRPREAERLRLWIASRRAGDRAPSDALAPAR